MFKLLGLVSFVLLSGCTVYNDRSVPVEVSIMPNDCANQQAIQNWLNYQIKQEPALLMDKELEQKEIVREIERIKDHYDLYNFLNTGGYRSQKLIDDFDNLLETDLCVQENVLNRCTVGS